MIAECLFPWTGAKQNDEMMERHNLQQQQQHLALADRVTHSAWVYCPNCHVSYINVKFEQCTE